MIVYDFSDYTDVTHLTPEAADRFSESLTDTIQKLLDNPEYPDEGQDLKSKL